MKACINCNRVLPLDAYYKHKQMADGCLNKCKECVKEAVKKNGEKVGNKYDFSEKGVIRVIYKTQQRHNHLRGHGRMGYTKLELSEWLYDNGYKVLYDNWVKGGNKRDEKPSVDRIDDHKGYSFDNIRLVTWLENRQHQHDDIINGIGTGGKRCKKLFKYDDSMNLISVYVSYSSAVREHGYSLEYAIRNNIKCRNGYYWSYDMVSDR